MGESDASALTRRNQEAIGDKNKKLADLNIELNNIKTNLAAKESKCKSTEEKFEEMKSSLGKKDKEVQELSKSITDLKQSNGAISEKEKELSSLKLKMEEKTLKQKSATEEKL